jgi:uncharacterized Zn finger protein (UPF0148 family)
MIKKCPRCNLLHDSESGYLLCPTCEAELDGTPENPDMSESQAMLQAERDAEMRMENEDEKV